jgi:hypothetical protein
MNKKSFFLVGAGVTNIVHATLHLLQFLQSIFIISSKDNEQIEHIMHNPFFSLLWFFVGTITLIIGIKDFKHHKKGKCNE